MVATFDAMGLSAAVMQAIGDLGFEEPTPIQQQAITVLISGADVIGQAQTGTGKTAAFGIPLIERITTGGQYPQALVLTPTRELAMQDAEAIHALGRHKEIRVAPIYGGQPIDRQLRLLRRGADIIIGTPGRVMDHIRRGTLSLHDVHMVVLDEADEMLNMGFAEDVEFILEQIPAERQIALFSATIPPRIKSLANRFLKSPQLITSAHEQVSIPQIRQRYFEVLRGDKLEALTRVLDAEAPTSAIIFTRTKRDAAELADQLAGLGYVAEPIHGDLGQGERDRVMRRFREGVVELLVATDVAARGLDIPAVSHVINFDVPADPEGYVHRIGRTGRAGKPGEAITLVTPRDRSMLRLIERTIGRRLRPERLPTAADVADRRREALKASMRSILQEPDLTPYLLVVEELAAEYDLTEIAAAALKLSKDLTVKRDRRIRTDTSSLPVADDGAGREPGMVKLVLDLGRRAGLRPADVVGAIANEAHIPGQSVGTIDIYDESAFVQVPEDDAQQIVSALRRSGIRGRRINVGIANSRPQPQ